MRIDNLLSMFLRPDFECLQQLVNLLDRLIMRALVARRTAPQGPLFRAQSRKSVGPYRVRIDNLLSISRSFVGGGSVPRSESPDGAGSYRTAPQGPLFRRSPGKAWYSTFVSSLRRACMLWNSLRHLGRLMDAARALFQIAPVSCD